MRCECGCGYEGEDEVAQFVIEEALMVYLELWEGQERRKIEDELHQEAAIADAQTRALEAVRAPHGVKAA